MDEGVLLGLSEDEVACLERVEGGMAIAADVSRADILLYCRRGRDEAVVVAQARPHSVAPIYEHLVGRVLPRQEKPTVFEVLESGRSLRTSQGLIAEGAPIFQEIFPILGPGGKPWAALSVEKTMIEAERHKRRLPVFRGAARQFQAMLIRGDLAEAKGLSPFGEYDGLVVVDNKRRILYTSGIANNLYRRLGYMESLVGKELRELETSDEPLVERALRAVQPLEEESKEGNRVWVRKVIPLLAYEEGQRWFLSKWREDRKVTGALIAIHDATAARRRERQARIRSAMVQEIHHRVKNNLQSIASLLRLEARRAKSREARKALRESINRILSVAVVHEFLSEHESRVINLKEVSRRVVEQLQRGMVEPGKEIELTVRGPDIYLPSHQATACALVINELLQNSLEHGYRRRREGTISLELRDDADKVTIEIDDDGRGLPEGFDLEADSSLGLTIVRTLVQEDLEGVFQLKDGGGVQAIITFPKKRLGGERDWEELE